MVLRCITIRIYLFNGNITKLHKIGGIKMNYEAILEMLEEIEGQLDDSFNSLPEWDGNSDGLGYLDGARNDLYNLKNEIERSILDIDKVTLDEVFNTPTINPL